MKIQILPTRLEGLVSAIARREYLIYAKKKVQILTDVHILAGTVKVM
jgi:hypothetical protein